MAFAGDTSFGIGLTAPATCSGTGPAASSVNGGVPFDHDLRVARASSEQTPHWSDLEASHPSFSSPCRASLAAVLPPDSSVGRVSNDFNSVLPGSFPVPRMPRSQVHAASNYHSVGSVFDRTPALSQDLADVQRAFEQIQLEIHMQSRRHEDVSGSVAKLESDLSRLAQLAVENEGLHAADRQQKNATFAGLSKRAEDSLLTCESLRKGQENLEKRMERLEKVADTCERSAEEVHLMQKELTALQTQVRDKFDQFKQVLRRLEAMEQIFEENTKLRQEVSQMRRANERKDLEMAAVQGQIDALTKLVREHIRDPLSPG